MNWLVYIGVFFLFLSYVLVPKKPVQGWAYGTLGNLFYIAAFWTYGRMELLIAPVLFTGLSGWNLWRELHKRPPTN